MILWNKPHVRPITKIVAYYRLDERESESRENVYRLEDQRRDVARFAADCGATIVREFFEIVSGTTPWELRPELNHAAHFAHGRATLVVGRQDRLATKVYIISGLMDEGLDFVSADDPNRGGFQKHMRAIFDQFGIQLGENCCVPAVLLREKRTRSPRSSRHVKR